MKRDYKKELSKFYGAKAGKPSVVHVPSMNYLMIDGHGDPNTSQEYIDAIQTLYPVAYTIKFICKNELDHDFSVMPLEGLWWTEPMTDFSAADKSNWLWTAMILQPPIVTNEIYQQAIDSLRPKNKAPLLDQLRFASYDEGRAAQILYLGPYANEGPTIQQLHAFIREQGGALTEQTKHHHEIYLGDPRRTDPTKLRTIIRQPF